MSFVAVQIVYQHIRPRRNRYVSGTRIIQFCIYFIKVFIYVVRGWSNIRSTISSSQDPIVEPLVGICIVVRWSWNRNSIPGFVRPSSRFSRFVHLGDDELKVTTPGTSPICMHRPGVGLYPCSADLIDLYPIRLAAFHWITEVWRWRTPPTGSVNWNDKASSGILPNQ